MKFHQLKTGERFTCQGEPYRKVSPLIAQHEKDGQQKMFRRADVIQIADIVEQSGAGTHQAVDTGAQKIEASLKKLRLKCELLLETYLPDLETREQAIKQLHDEYSNIINDMGVARQ